MDTLTMLLEKELPAPQTKEVKVKRLTEAFGTPFVLTLKQIPFHRVRDIQKMNGTGQAINNATILEGVVSPNLRDARLMEKYGVHTPGDVLPILFTPGEIDEIAEAIEELSGYRKRTLELVEDIKKK